MRRTTPTALLLALFFAAPAFAAGWQAGAAKVDITPEAPIRLSGYGGRTAPSEGVEDPIYARVLILKDGEGILTALISVDSIGVPHWVREEVIGTIRDRLGIYHVRLVLASTHSHTTPHLHDAIPNLFETSPEEDEVIRRYTMSLIGKIVKAIDGAAKSLRPASLVLAKGQATFAKNRRTAGGPVEHDLPVLAALDATGKPIAIAFNYACHATTLEGDFNRVSGDWPGAASAAIEEAHLGAVALAFIGCGGDANPEPRGKLPHVREHGRAIAEAAAKALAGPVVKLTPKIDAQLEYVQLRYAKVPTKEDLENLLKDGRAHMRRHAQHQLDRLARGGSVPSTLSYPVQVLSLPEATLVFLGGEVVVDYALRLRREIPGRELWISAYSNDVPCYIASRRVLSEGGYEADDSMIWYDRPSRWDPSVEDVVIEKARQLIGSSGVEGLTRRVKPPPALSPQDALKSIRVQPGFRVELAAAEPEVTDPVAIAFDERGRLYAAEMRDYPLGPGRGKPFDGRVRLLQDTDGDGYYERSTVFADNVPWANGIACANGGVFVTAAPDVLFLEDKDGDGRAEVRQKVYSGFNLGNSQHLVNTMKLSLDNWIYLNGGDSADLRSPVKPGLPPVSGSGVSFRLDPRTLAMELTSGYRGGFGMGFSTRGERFVCDNQDHAVHVVLEREFLARNPDLRVEETMGSLSDHGARVYPVSAPLERFNDPGDAGRFSSACGVHVYQGDALPEAYRGNLFSCEPVSNLVHRDVLSRSGASFTAARGDEKSEFLASTDYWFRPVSCDTGPDGALYVVDMYREVIEHPQWIPEHMQRLFDLRSGMDRGRIYRVVYVGDGEKRPAAGAGAAGAAAAKAGDLSALQPGELVALLSHPNGWRRLTAQRLLVERRDPAAVELLTAAAAKAVAPLGRLHALWALEGLQALRADELAAALRDADPGVRSAACLLAGRNLGAASSARRPAAPALVEGLARLAEDADPSVRFQAALSLGALAPAERLAPLTKIALRDAADRWTRTAVLASLDQDPTPLLEAAVAAGGARPGEPELIRSLSTLAGSRKRPAEVARALAILTREMPPRARWAGQASAELLQALGSGALEEALRSAGAEGDRARAGLAALLEHAGGQARNESVPLPERIGAVELLAHSGSPATVALLGGLLDSRYPQDLQKKAVASLASLPGADTRREAARALLRAFPGQTPQVQRETLEAMVQDGERIAALLKALESGDVLPHQIDASRRKLLLESTDAEVSSRSAKVFADLAASPDRAALVEDYRKTLGAKLYSGDASRGEPLFMKVCSQCHRAGTQGFVVGADLSGMRARAPDALLLDILDPSRAVSPEYLNYLVVTRDRRTLNGILASETPSGITLRRAEGKTETVLRRDLAEMKALSQSLMPDGMEKDLKPADLADVIAFVRSGLAPRGQAPTAVTGKADPPAPAASGKAGAPAAPAPATAAAAPLQALAGSLAFFAPFDGSPDAVSARGDKRIYTASELYGKEVKPGLSSGNVTIAAGQGKFGDALRFAKKEKPAVYFQVEGNLPYRKTDWGGTISFWMKLDPDRDLEPGFADPLQITEREWNDAAFFVDFSKDDKPRHFRLGAFPDRAVWDPTRRDWEKVPPAERPLADAGAGRFAGDRWTHVAIAFSRFNTGRPDGASRLYIDGALAGELTGRVQTFTWDSTKAKIWLGLSYTGLLDELALFDRELSAEEVRALSRIEGGVKALAAAPAPAAGAPRIEQVAGGLRSPFGVDFDAAGNMLVIELTGNRLLRIDREGKVEVLAGTGEKGDGGDGGPGKDARLNGPHALAVGPGGEVYIADTWNNRVRVFDPKTGVISAFAGIGEKAPAADGTPAAQARLGGIYCVAIDGPRGRLIITDLDSRRIRAVDLKTKAITTVAGNGEKGVPTDGAEASGAPLVDPRAAIADREGRIYILERSGNALRIVDENGKIRTVAGTGKAGDSGDGGEAIRATLNGPKHLCMDQDGSVLIADTENHRVRRYLPGERKIVGFAGVGRDGTAGLGGSPEAAELKQPHGVFVHPSGTIYISDSSNDRVLRIVR